MVRIIQDQEIDEEEMIEEMIEVEISEMEGVIRMITDVVMRDEVEIGITIQIVIVIDQRSTNICCNEYKRK